MRCKWVVDNGERIRIPGCWGSVIHWGDDDFGASHCTCYDTARKRRKISVVKKLKAEIKRLKNIANRSE